MIRLARAAQICKKAKAGAGLPIRDESGKYPARNAPQGLPVHVFGITGLFLVDLPQGTRVSLSGELQTGD